MLIGVLIKMIKFFHLVFDSTFWYIRLLIKKNMNFIASLLLLFYLIAQSNFARSF